MIWGASVRDAFIVGEIKEKGINKNSTANGAETFGWVDIDASKFSSIYGQADTTQPASVQLLPCIKL